MAKGKGGRPHFRPTDEDRQTVRKLAGYGLTQEQIAQVIVNPSTNKPISVDTLHKSMGTEFHEGHVTASAKVARTAFQMAVSGEAPAMTMFWLKTQCKWREKHDVEVTGKDGKDLTFTFAIDSAHSVNE